jgi:hypothetical protein
MGKLVVRGRHVFAYTKQGRVAELDLDASDIPWACDAK